MQSGFLHKTANSVLKMIFFAHVAIFRKNLCVGCKGHLISECLLGAIDFPKKQWKIWQISALESKKW